MVAKKRREEPKVPNMSLGRFQATYKTSKRYKFLKNTIAIISKMIEGMRSASFDINLADFSDKTNARLALFTDLFTLLHTFQSYNLRPKTLIANFVSIINIVDAAHLQVMRTIVS